MVTIKNTTCPDDLSTIMLVEDATIEIGEGMMRPPQTIVKEIECSKLQPGDLILTQAIMDTTKVISVHVNSDMTRIVYTTCTEKQMETSFLSHQKLLRVDKSSLN